MPSRFISILLAEYAIWVILLSPIYLIITHKKQPGLKSAVAGFLVWLAGEVTKLLFFLPRPFMKLSITPFIKPLYDGSFPSNHTAVSFAIAFTIFQYFPKQGTFLLLLSLAVGLGRVMVMVHYPQDVIGGIILGYAGSWFTQKYLFRH
jgi:undecaprenyl-diphosphatase